MEYRGFFFSFSGEPRQTLGRKKMGFLTFFIPLTLDSFHFNDIKQLKLVLQPGEQFMLCIKLGIE